MTRPKQHSQMGPSWVQLGPNWGPTMPSWGPTGAHMECCLGSHTAGDQNPLNLCIPYSIIIGSSTNQERNPQHHLVSAGLPIVVFYNQQRLLRNGVRGLPGVILHGTLLYIVAFLLTYITGNILPFLSLGFS